MHINRRSLAGYCLLVLWILCSPAATSLRAQKNAVEGFKRKDTLIFRYPLDIPVEISGCFGELRSTHFHGGIDFRTQQREGLEVYSIGPGNIIRAEVSKASYGKALYVQHPGGLVSLYAHLSEFTGPLGKKIKKLQKQSGKYEVRLEGLNLKTAPKKPIALSGNSGSSGGPHLHLEIRRGDTLRLNPSAWGLPVYDTVSPVFYYLAVYEGIGLTDTLAVETEARHFADSCLQTCLMDAPEYDFLMERALAENFKQQRFPVLQVHYYDTKNLPDTLYLRNLCGFGLCALDYIQDMPFRYGLYELRFEVEHEDGHDTLAYYKLDALSNAVYGGIRHHLDEDFYTQYKKRLEKGWVEDETTPTPYSELHNRGLYEGRPGSPCTLKVTGRDFSGNETSIKCILVYL